MDIRKTLLRGYVAKAITCQLSGNVLDMKSAVSVEITGPNGGHGMAVYDGPTYDARIAPNIPAMRDNGYTVEIIDGREL